MWRCKRQDHPSLINMEKNKRGVSPIIATVLIAMISIAAIAILAGALVPFVRESLQKSAECMPYKEYFLFDESFGYNCKTSENIYIVSIKASFDKTLSENIEGAKLVLNRRDGTNKVLEIRQGASSSLLEGGISIAGEVQANLRIPSKGGIVSYVYNASVSDEFLSAEVYPVLNGGRICADSIESIDIKSC